MTPHMTGNESDQLNRLHAQDGQTSSVISPHCLSHALQLRSPEADLSRPSSIFTKNESDNTENISRSPELTEDIHMMYVQEFKTYYQQDQRCTQGGPTQTQQMSMSTLTSPNVSSNRKLERFTEDIVERNKITLGRNTPKCGSYVMVHGLKQAMPHNVNKVCIECRVF